LENEESMRATSMVIGLLLAVSVSAPGLAAPAGGGTPSATASARVRAAPAPKPTWEQCFGMSITRGFNHDTDEWLQSIQDCLAGKIPL
jgi:hypothetical protein